MVTPSLIYYRKKDMYRIIALLIFLWFLSSLSAIEKQYFFLQVNSAKGLVNNQITCIYKDSRGFVWIGTTAGLSRFDGESYVNYKHNSSDPKSIIDNYIVSIQEDAKHNLWIETRSSYIVYDVNKERFDKDITSYLGIKGQSINIQQVYFDSYKNLWLKESDQNFFKKKNQDTKDYNLAIKGNVTKDHSVVSFFHSQGNYYYLFSNGLIQCFDDKNYQLVFEDNYLSNKMGNDSLNTQLFVDAEKDMWFFGNNQGLYHYKNRLKKWEKYSDDEGKIRLSSKIINQVIQDDKSNIWIGTDHGGVDIINKFSNEVQTIYHQPDNDKSIAQNSITELYIDDKNIIWVGTFKNGVSYYHESIHKFPHFRHLLSDPNSIPYSDVNCFAEDKKGNLWIGTNGGGLIYFDRKQNKYTTYKYIPNNSNSISNNVVVSLYVDSKDILWIGTFTGGLNRFDGKRFKRFKEGGKPNCIPNNNIWSITEDDHNNLWIGTLGGGIVIYDSNTDSFKKLPNAGNINLPTQFVNQIYRLSDGNMFIATATGVVFYNVKEKRYKYHPTINKKEPYPISEKTVNAVFEDSRGLLWVATREGLIVLDLNSEFIKYFRAEDGLAEDVINRIEEDEFQSIWVSKSTGLSQLVVSKSIPDDNYQFKVFDYTEEDGLQGKEFNTNASIKTSKNELIFGGPNGFNLFEVKDVKYNKVLPQVVFTDLQVYNQTILPDDEIGSFELLKKSIDSTRDVELKHSMNVFTIGFTALDFFIPSKIKYQYRLKGFNDDWITLEDNRNSVTYTNLNAGDYYFQVKAANNDGLWNEEFAELHLKVLPPFYATKLAYFIYGFIILLLVIYLRYTMLRKERLKFAMEQEQIQTRRNHEMDEMKLRFLTNVSHEFRTPLTLILTPLDKLLKQVKSTSDKKLLETIDKNAKQLLELVNQLLDFRKLELHGLRYNPSHGNIVAFLNEVIENFSDAFKKKNIQYSFIHQKDRFLFHFDKEKLQKVIMNLLSNALKFTPEKGHVIIMLNIDEESKYVEITVEDTGIGIKDEDLDKIFVRFYQSENNKKMGLSGSGIGLNLAREMVQLHNGTLNVESTFGKGSKFIVNLPIEVEEELGTEDIQLSVNENNNEAIVEVASTDKKPVILLVEDNVDFRSFMQDALSDKFTIHEAPDGKVAYDKVHQIHPDLIISDVMMPEVDGLELCEMLRKDIRTSHIPIILLTARTADEDKIKGLEIGADDYITKPFNMDLLLLRVDKLLEKRSKFQQQFQKTVEINPSEVQITSMDEKLIKKAVATVEKNIAESGFTVEDLSKSLGMSRVYLYKKLLAITGKTPIEFIRIIRLKRGAQLLEKSQMNVSEVAYEVGFNSPRYFSKYFKEEYGMLPTAYMKKYEL